MATWQFRRPSNLKKSPLATEQCMAPLASSARPTCWWRMSSIVVIFVSMLVYVNGIQCVLSCWRYFVFHVCFAAFVHSFGNPEDPEPKNYKVTKNSDRRSTALFNYHAGNTSLFRNSNVTVQNWFYIPCTAATRVYKDKNVKIVTVHAVQRSETVTEVYYSLTRNFWTWPILDHFFQMAMAVTLDEDRRILETVNYERGNKMNTKYDALQLHFRRALKKHLVQETEWLTLCYLSNWHLLWWALWFRMNQYSFASFQQVFGQLLFWRLVFFCF